MATLQNEKENQRSKIFIDVVTQHQFDKFKMKLGNAGALKAQRHWIRD